MALADTAARLQTDALRQIAVQRAEEAATTAKLTAVRNQVAALQAQATTPWPRRPRSPSRPRRPRPPSTRSPPSNAAEVASVAAQRAAEKARLDSLQRQSDHLAAILLGAGPPRSTAGSTAGPAACCPTRRSGRCPRRSGCASTRSCTYWRMHTGQDWAIPCGTPVHAAATGRIIAAGWARAAMATGSSSTTAGSTAQRPGDDVQPPEPHRAARRPRVPRPADRLLRHDRLLDRLPPALRGHGSTARRSTRKRYL